MWFFSYGKLFGNKIISLLIIYLFGMKLGLYISNYFVPQNIAWKLLYSHKIFSVILCMIKINVFRIGSVIKLEKLLVHGSLVGLTVEPRLNRWHHKYIFYYFIYYKKLINSLHVHQLRQKSENFSLVMCLLLLIRQDIPGINKHIIAPNGPSKFKL